MSTHAQKTLRRAVPPLVLAAAGVWLLVGCVYIPGFGRVMSGTDVSLLLPEDLRLDGVEQQNRRAATSSHSTRPIVAP